MKTAVSMSKAKLVAAGLAAVQVLAEWSAELSGFRETEHGTRNMELLYQYNVYD